MSTPNAETRLHKLDLIAHGVYVQCAADFEEHYELNDYLIIGDTRYAKNKTHRQQGRHCLFCNKIFPEATFASDAHLISRMLGNTDLFSTFECDACNNKFSKLETDLASFLGLGRSISGMMNAAKAPGFPGIGIEAKSLIFKGKKLLVLKKAGANYDPSSGRTKLNYLKPSYTPANVYKLLLKCALSVLPHQEVTMNFQIALKYLNGEVVLQGAHANVFQFSLAMKLPLHIQIFKKKRLQTKLPTYIASIYTDNLVISFPVLLHQEDLEMLNENIDIPIAPPYFIDGHEFDQAKPIYTRYELSSLTKLKGEPEEMTMEFDKDEMQHATRFNTQTGEVVEEPYNPAGSKYFIQMESDTSFTREELKELHDLIDQKFSNSK